MAQRESTKAKRPAARQDEASSGLNDAVQRLEARSKALELERDGLKAELAAARNRLDSLEAARDQVVRKIDGMISSLKSVIGKE